MLSLQIQFLHVFEHWWSPVVLEVEYSLAVVTTVWLKLVERFDERAYLRWRHPWFNNWTCLKCSSCCATGEISSRTKQALSCRRSLGTDSTDILPTLLFSLKQINLCQHRSLSRIILHNPSYNCHSTSAMSPLSIRHHFPPCCRRNSTMSGSSSSSA